MGDSLVCVSDHPAQTHSTTIQSFDSLLTRPKLTRSLRTDRVFCVCVPCVDLVCGGGRFMSKYLSTVCKSAYIFVWWFAERVCVYVVISLSCFPLSLLVCVCMILLTFFVVTSVFNYHPCIYHSWNYYSHNFHCWFLIPPWIFSEIQPSELTSMLQIQMKRLDEQLNDQTNSTAQWPLTIIFILI